MKIGKTLHPTPHTPHPAPTKNFLPQTLGISTKSRCTRLNPPKTAQRR
ncbi:MAG: hypothetical protein PX636_21500 [Microcystis sp. M53598_WE2]|nr:hypothetical protein [Microcystis sp. M53600_WE12]MDJ0673497.1 hypothetical protein [Microcystis sp. M53598_WE2]